MGNTQQQQLEEYKFLSRTKFDEYEDFLTFVLQLNKIISLN